jgi:hypothetical protein
MMFAENIVNGFYTHATNPNLMNAPGFPLYLAIFLKLNLPLWVPKFINGILVMFAAYFLYRALLYYAPHRTALFVSYAFGLYVPMFKWIRLNFSESVCLFLFAGFIYFSVKALRADKFRWKDVLIPSFMLGYAILCKAQFAYVAFATLIFAIAAYIFLRDGKAARGVAILATSFLLAVPYLIYTYSLTGRVLYWGSNGGEQLYWMSSDKENEYGMWIESDLLLNRLIPDMHPEHIRLYDSVYAIGNWVEMNDIFYAKAKENIKANPRAYLYNVAANAWRLVSDGPTSYSKSSMRPLAFLFANSFIILPLIFSIYLGWINRRAIPLEVLGLTLFVLMYLGASLLHGAVIRYFVAAVPFLLLWLGFVYSNFLRITIVRPMKDP